MSNVGYATLTVLPSLQGFQGALAGQLNPALTNSSHQTGAAAGHAFGSGFMPFLAKWGPLAGLAAGALVVKGVSQGLKTAGFLEQAKISFETLLGPGGDAEGFLSSLSKFAAKTPFELPGLVDNARGLLGAGAAASTVIPTMTALGDASGALGLDQERLNRVMLAWNQIQTKGKVQSEELMQITEAGIPIWQLLSKAMGKPVPELQSMVTKGQLLANDVLPLLSAQMEKDYGGSMAKQAATLNGVWSTFKDTLNIALAQAMQPLIPILAKVLPGAATILAGAITGISNGFVALFSITSTSSSALAPITSGLAPIGAIIGNTIIPALVRLGTAIGTGVAPILQYLGGIFKTQLIPLIQELQAKAVPIFQQVGVVIGDMANLAGPALKFLGDLIKNVWTQVGPIVIDTVRAIFGVVSGVVSGLLTVIGGLVKFVTALFKGDWRGAWDAAKQIVMGALDIIVAVVGGALNIVKNLFAMSWGSLVVVVRGAWTGISTAVSNGVNGAVSWVQSLPGRVLGAAAPLANLLVVVGSNMMAGFVRGISSWAGNIYNSIMTPIRNSVNAVKDFLGIHSPSRLLFGIGLNTAKGTANGLWAGAKLVAKASESLVPAIPKIAGGVPITPGGLAATMAGSKSKGMAIEGSLDLGNGLHGYVRGIVVDEIDSETSDLAKGYRA